MGCTSRWPPWLRGGAVGGGGEGGRGRCCTRSGERRPPSGGSPGVTHLLRAQSPACACGPSPTPYGRGARAGVHIGQLTCHVAQPRPPTPPPPPPPLRAPTNARHLDRPPADVVALEGLGGGACQGREGRAKRSCRPPAMPRVAALRSSAQRVLKHPSTRGRRRCPPPISSAGVGARGVGGWGWSQNTLLPSAWWQPLGGPI